MKNTRYYGYLSFDEDDAYSDEKVKTRHNVARILHQLVQVRHLHITPDQSKKDTRRFRLDIPTVIRIRKFLGLPDPDPLVRGPDTDPSLFS
jgi:hypothetical protein